MALPPDASCGNCDTALVERLFQNRTLPYCPGCQSWWDARTLERVHRFRKPLPKGRTVSLVFEPNGKAHNDLVLRVGEWAHRSDSYYYELDHPVGQPSDAVGSIRKLLDQWASSVRSAAVGEKVYLPHDFSDQATGWLRCERATGDEFEIVAGWSNVEGYAFYPSDYGEIAGSMSDFDPLAAFEPFRIQRERLLADIEASDAALSIET